MKKSISIVLCLVMLLSIFSVCGVVAGAADASNVMYVKSDNSKEGELTYTIYLKKNVTLAGAIVRVQYDPMFMEPVSGGAHTVVDAYGDTVESVSGIYVFGDVAGVDGMCSLGFVNMDGYKTGSSDKGFMTVTFKVKASDSPNTTIKFYCVEFNSSDEALNIPKNDANPQLFHTVYNPTLNGVKISSVYSVENGLRVTWEPVKGANGYSVYKVSGSTYTLLGSVPSTATSYDDETAVANATTTYAVRAYNANGFDSGLLGTLSGVYVKAPDKVAVSIQPESIKLGWTTVSGATSYDLYRRVVNADGSRGAWVLLSTAAATATTYFDSYSLVGGTQYEYTVRARVAGGASAVCRYATIYYYKAPTIEAVSAVGGVSITWDAIEGAETYNIYRRYNGSTTWTLIKTVDAGTLKYLDADATTGRNIDYAVRAFAKGGSSTFVEKRCAYVATPILTGVSNATNGVYVKWDAVTGATGYRVYRRGAGATSWTYLDTVKTTSYTDTKATSGNYWRYTVITEFYKVRSGFDTNGLYLKYIATPKLTSISNSVGGLTVNWSAVSGVTGYRVYRRGAGQTTWTYLGTVTGTSYTDKNVSNGAYYRYTVRGASGSTFSGFDTNGLYLRYVATPKLTKISNASNGINITWSSVSGITGYRVYRRGAGQTTWTYLGTVTGTSYTDKNVAKGSYYRYTVRAAYGSTFSGFDTNGLYIKRS